MVVDVFVDCLMVDVAGYTLAVHYTVLAAHRRNVAVAYDEAFAAQEAGLILNMEIESI